MVSHLHMYSVTCVGNSLFFNNVVNITSDVLLNQFNSLIFIRYFSLYAIFKVHLLDLNNSNPVGLSGLEPPTSRLSGVRSNRLSYKPSVVSDARKFLSGWRRRDSNSRPPACKAGALPTELRPRLKLAATCSPTPSPVQYHRPLRS